jgi:hypothetical protein
LGTELSQLPLCRTERLLFEVARHLELLRVEGVDQDTLDTFLCEYFDATPMYTREDINAFVCEFLDSDPNLSVG